MMNTRKILMVVGGLLLGATGTTYLMLLQEDRHAMAEVSAAIDESARPPVVDSRISDHTTEGGIGQAKPSAQQPVVLAPASVPVLAAAPAPTTAAPESSPAAAHGTGQPKPQAQPKQTPSTAVASVNVQDSGAPKMVQAQHARRGRDGLDRRAITTHGSTRETDELVKASAKLDPSLPPPDMFAARAAMNRSSSKPGTGSNPVAAAMTDQLVRDSAKLDPSLPPPR